jgi:hypothetical protein
MTVGGHVLVIFNERCCNLFFASPPQLFEAVVQKNDEKDS